MKAQSEGRNSKPWTKWKMKWIRPVLQAHVAPLEVGQPLCGTPLVVQGEDNSGVDWHVDGLEMCLRNKIK